MQSQTFDVKALPCWICPPHTAPKGKHNSNPIIQSTLEGVFVARHESLRAAARATGFTPQSITHAILKHKNHTANGYRWEMEEG